MRGWFAGLFVIGLIALAMIYAYRPDFFHSFQQMLFAH